MASPFFPDAARKGLADVNAAKASATQNVVQSKPRIVNWKLGGVMGGDSVFAAPAIGRQPRWPCRRLWRVSATESECRRRGRCPSNRSQAELEAWHGDVLASYQNVHDPGHYANRSQNHQTENAGLCDDDVFSASLFILPPCMDRIDPHSVFLHSLFSARVLLF